MPDIGAMLGGFLEGYVGTGLRMDEQSFAREQARRKARADILFAALPTITDPNLRAEAIALAEELATGKTGKKRTGISAILGGLIGRQPQDVGQGEGLREFLTRPREATVRPPAATTVSLPPIPGLPPAAATHQLPGVREEVLGPMATPEEMQAQTAASMRAEILAKAGAQAEVTEQTAARRRELVRQMPGFEELTPQQQFEVLFEVGLSRSGEPTGAGLVNVAGTVPGAALRQQMPVDSLGQPVRDDTEYRVVRTREGGIGAAYPVTTTATGLKETWWRDPDSSTGFTRAYQNPATGRFHAVTRDLMPPPAWVATTTTSQSVRFVLQADNSYVATPVTTTTTRERALPGVTATAPPAGAPTSRATAPRLPPVPGTPAPAQVVGAKPAEEVVIHTADGRTVVGHKGMTVADRRDIGSVALSLYLAGELRDLLNAPDPQNPSKRLRDRTGGWEQINDALKARWGAARYTTLGITSGSEFLQRAMPLSNLARVIFASPYLRGVRAYQWVQDIQRHIPDATKQSPAAMAERLDVLIPVLENMRGDLQSQLGLSQEQMAQFMRDAATKQNIPAPGASKPPAKKEIPPLPPSLR